MKIHRNHEFKPRDAAAPAISVVTLQISRELCKNARYFAAGSHGMTSSEKGLESGIVWILNSAVNVNPALLSVNEIVSVKTKSAY